MSSHIPQKHQSKPNNPHDHQLSSILLDVVQLVPRKEEAEVYHVPEEVLSGAHLVEGHKDEGLYEHTEGKVMVEFIPWEEEQEHLRNKGHGTLDERHILIIQIKVVEVNREVVSVVLPNEVVQIRLIQELPAKLQVEEANYSEERACGD